MNKITNPKQDHSYHRIENSIDDIEGMTIKHTRLQNEEEPSFIVLYCTDENTNKNVIMRISWAYYLSEEGRERKFEPEPSLSVVGISYYSEKDIGKDKERIAEIMKFEEVQAMMGKSERIEEIRKMMDEINEMI